MLIRSYNDTPAVREVIDLVCDRADAIVVSYPEKDERELHDSYKAIKIFSVYEF